MAFTGPFGGNTNPGYLLADLQHQEELITQRRVGLERLQAEQERARQQEAVQRTEITTPQQELEQLQRQLRRLWEELSPQQERQRQQDQADREQRRLSPPSSTILSDQVWLSPSCHPSQRLKPGCIPGINITEPQATAIERSATYIEQNASFRKL